MFHIQKVVSAFGRQAFRTSTLTTTATTTTKRLSSSSTTAANIKTASAAVEQTTASTSSTSSVDESSQLRSKNPMVAAAFDSLLSNEETTTAKSAADVKSDDINERIINAKTVSSLLAVADANSAVTRKHALKIVSILAEWSSINRAQLADFENDARFIKLCRLLGRAVTNNNNSGNNKSKNATAGGAPNAAANNNKIAGFRTDDLNTVIGVAGDDEAAKLIASISIPQMIKVMSALAQKKRRSTPLLRSLAYNISSNSDALDLKQCADLLYAMAVLNFPDSMLIGRISMDVQNGLQQNKDKPAAVGSIITSLGLLRYRDADLLESLTEWVLLHADICRPQDVSSLLLTLATLNYATTKSEAIRTQLAGSLAVSDFNKSLDWLNNVWALVVLNLADAQQMASVLKPEFIAKLVAERAGSTDLTPTTKLKLLNIDAATELQSTTYTGDRLAASSTVFEAPLQHGKNKVVLVDGMLDALKSLFASEANVRTNVNTKMGFLIDAECVLGAKSNPLPVDGEHKDAVRLAIMVLDFHDMCQGVHNQPNGVTALAFRLLEQKGYRVLTVPYNEFSTSDKLLKRVQYLESKMKRIATNKE